MDATHCPCGSMALNDGLSTLDHDGRCPECEGYCAPSECECESEYVTAFQSAHGFLAEQCVRVLVALGEARDAAERDVARSASEGPDHIEWLLSDITLNPEYYRAADVAHTCSCGRCYDHDSFEALPAPAKGAYMDDGADGCLVLRNCKCGSTRARQGTAADVDAWHLEQLASDLEYLDRCEWNTRAAIADREERVSSEVAA